MNAEPLKAALLEYDRTAPERQQLWDQATCEADVAPAQAADRAALAKVQEAFYQVTKDRNCRANCYLVDIKFLRKVADK